MIKRTFKLVKTLFGLVWFVVFLLIGARFTQLNDTPVSIDFIFWQMPEVSSGLLLCLVFAAGLIVGVLAVAPLMAWNSRRLKSLKSSNQTLRKKDTSTALSEPLH